jgi:L-amino acid N-acyltransferase YncA
MGYQPWVGAKMPESGLPNGMWQGKGIVRNARPSGDGRARVARNKTWRMVDDDQPETDFVAMCNLTSSSEVKPRDDRGNELTSFLPKLEEEQLETTTPSSSPADMTNFSFLDSTTSEHTLDTSTRQTKSTEIDENNMTAHPLQGRKRLKYKEPPTVLASPDFDPAHSHSNDILTRMTERITTPIEVTPEAIETAATPLVPYSSSSAASDHHPPQTADSAVEMGGKGNRKKQSHPLTEEVQELTFRGRRSVNPSNATNDSWRWDPVLGALVSITSGASYKPAAESAKADATASVANTRLEDSKWAEKPLAKATQPRRGWSIPEQPKERNATAGNDGWAAINKHDHWTAPANNGWDTGHPPYPSKARLDAESQQHNKSQARAPAKQISKPRESPWIKDSLIPKGDPNRHKARWSSSASESAFDSNRVSSGRGTRRRRDQGDGADIADWAGGLGPASIDWDSRSRFRDHQSVARIESWLDGNVIALEQVTAIKHEVTVQGDIVPRYWFQAQLDGKSANVFWVEHIGPRQDNIRPLDREDLKGAKPWWNNYVDDYGSVLKPFEHPEVAGMDPDEIPEERRAREHDNGSGNAGESRRLAEKAKRDAHRKRTLAKREKAHKFSGTHNLNQGSTSSDTIKPGLNIFIRSAAKEDMVQLRDIYNRYIDNAFVVPETDRLTETELHDRWQAIKNVKLPFVVACQRGEVVKARNMRVNRGEDMVMPDKVIGFAFAADWSDGTCIFRPTVKLEVFVHMEQYMKQVGNCLTDKMMGLIDPQFVERGGYDVVGEDLERVEPARVISNVLIRYSYESNNKAKLLWVSNWLKRRFGFQQVADLQGVAQKFDKQ